MEKQNRFLAPLGFIFLAFLLSQCFVKSEAKQCQERYIRQFLNETGRQPSSREKQAILQGCIQSLQK